MGIRIQPREIEIPEDDPFKYDLLDRKEPISVLTHIIGSIDGPCVLAVDAPWGAGKTTFLKIWEQHLRIEGFPVVSFNAWETDFSDDPFIALSDAILQGLEHYKDGSLDAGINEFRRLTIEVVKRSAPGLIKMLTHGIVDTTPIFHEEIHQALATDAEERLSGFRDAQESINNFSHTLEDVARDLAESKGCLPLVIVIDELDRCRPSYAVELLEAAKHIFAVDHVVFVLAVNRSELAHSVRALYGIKFDAMGYLNRFFDIDFRLPEPPRRRYIQTALEVSAINSYFQDNIVQQRYSYHPPIQQLLEAFYGVPALSIRTIAQSIHRLGLVLASERTYRPMFILSAVVALIMRAMDPALYQQFIRAEVDDTRIIDAIYENPEYRVVDWRSKAHFDAAIIVAAWEIRHSYSPIDGITGSPLLGRYNHTIELSDQEERPLTEDERRAKEVIELVNVFSGNSFDGARLRFMDAVQRLELLSAEITVERHAQI